jgi:hypothetical protein
MVAAPVEHDALAPRGAEQLAIRQFGRSIRAKRADLVFQLLPHRLRGRIVQSPHRGNEIGSAQPAPPYLSCTSLPVRRRRGVGGGVMGQLTGPGTAPGTAMGRPMRLCPEGTAAAALLVPRRKRTRNSADGGTPGPTPVDDPVESPVLGPVLTPAPATLPQQIEWSVECRVECSLRCHLRWRVEWHLRGRRSHHRERPTRRPAPLSTNSDARRARVHHPSTMRVHALGARAGSGVQ